MQLTLTPIDSVLRSGFAEHSQVANCIINTLKCEYNIHVSACYVQDSTQLLVPPHTSIKKLIRSNKLDFINETILTFYIHSKISDLSLSEYNFKKILHDVFFKTLHRNELSLQYRRTYSPEEINYYGWNHTRKNDWNTQNIIPSKPAVQNKEIINIEYIDRLALWNYMNDALRIANEYEILKQINAKVFVSFNQDIPVYFIILPYEHSYFTDLDLSAEFSIHMTDILKPLDVWNVITPASMTPILSTWNALSPEQRFA